MHFEYTEKRSESVVSVKWRYPLPLPTSHIHIRTRWSYPSAFHLTVLKQVSDVVLSVYCFVNYYLLIFLFSWLIVLFDAHLLCFIQHSDQLLGSLELFPFLLFCYLYFRNFGTCGGLLYHQIKAPSVYRHQYYMEKSDTWSQ